MSFHILRRGSHERLRQREEEACGGSWSLERNRGARRAGWGPQSFKCISVCKERRKREATKQLDRWVSSEGGVSRDLQALQVALKITRLRGGASGGYNYDDDDYYGGPAGEDPYYEDGGWGQDARGRGGRNDRNDPYYDRRESRRGRGTSGGGFDLRGTITRGNKMYGVYALTGSILLTMMGISLMFEKNLIRLGNLGFIAGVALLIGPSNVVRYFTQASKLRGTIIFALGFFLVLTGNPIFGLAVEVFGFLNLFGNMLPMLWAMASNMPFVKDIIGSGASQRRTSGKGKQGRQSRQPPRRHRGDGYGYEDDEWDNGGGNWGYEDYDYDPYRR